MKKLAIIIIIIVGVFAGVSTPVLGIAGSADQSKIYYEMGFSFSLQNNPVKAKEYFEKAVGEQGQFSEPARLELFRMTAGTAETLEKVRQQLGQFQDNSIIPLAWKTAMGSLYDAGKKDWALELALEMPYRYPQSKEADDAKLLAAEIFFEKKAFSAALEQLQQLLDAYPSEDSADDAYYFMARIYASPGEYHSPLRARGALSAFLKLESNPNFADSIWKEDVRRLLFELGGLP